jgi:molecular chaperone DnaK (HSP70)
MDIKVLGIDLGKTVCSLAGLDDAGAVVFRKRLQRHRLLDFLDRKPAAARITSGAFVFRKDMSRG